MSNRTIKTILSLSMFAALIATTSLVIVVTPLGSGQAVAATVKEQTVTYKAKLLQRYTEMWAIMKPAFADKRISKVNYHKIRVKLAEYKLDISYYEHNGKSPKGIYPDEFAKHNARADAIQTELLSMIIR